MWLSAGNVFVAVFFKLITGRDVSIFWLKRMIKYETDVLVKNFKEFPSFSPSFDNITQVWTPLINLIRKSEMSAFATTFVSV